MVRDMEYKKKFKVTDEMVAKGIGLNVNVLSTPSLILSMEITCHEAISKELSPEETTVGTGICMRHLKSTKLGEEFTVKAILEERNGRKLKFRVEAWDSQGKIGEGEHYRYLVNKKEFEEKLNK